MLILCLLEDTGRVLSLKLLHMCLSTSGDLRYFFIHTLFIKKQLLEIREINQCTRLQCCLGSSAYLAYIGTGVQGCQAVSQNISQFRYSTEGFFLVYYHFRYLFGYYCHGRALGSIFYSLSSFMSSSAQSSTRAAAFSAASISFARQLPEDER